MLARPELEDEGAIVLDQGFIRPSGASARSPEGSFALAPVR